MINKGFVNNISSGGVSWKLKMREKVKDTIDLKDNISLLI